MNRFPFSFRVFKAVLLIAFLSGLVLPLSAQTPAPKLPFVTMEVKLVNKKNTASSTYSRGLVITIRNLSNQPIQGADLRWGILKQAYDLVALDAINSSCKKNGAAKAFGAEEKLDLHPMEVKVFETALVEAVDGRRGEKQKSGERFVGHGVELSYDMHVLAEQYFNPQQKGSLKELLAPTGTIADAKAAGGDAAVAAAGKPKKEKKNS